MSGKPQLSRNDELGRFGASHVQTVIETGWRCVFAPIEGYSDRGFDGMVFDHVRGRSTAIQFNVQVKTRSSYPNDATGTFAAPVDKSHLELYRDSMVPTVLVCVEVGPPLVAFWRVVRRKEASEALRTKKRLRLSRQDIFGPGSRDAVITEVNAALPRQVPDAVRGRLLPLRLQTGIRRVAKDYYRRYLMDTPVLQPFFGSVNFTWMGWRHITRRSRSAPKIPSSLLLLPCLPALLANYSLPKRSRVLPPIVRGDWTEHRALLIFEQVVTFRHRAPAWVRVVLARKLLMPTAYETLPPDYRRKLEYTFRSISELTLCVTAKDITGPEE